jgi:DNA replication and repair protein RecF
VHLSFLHLRDFRNFVDQRLELPPAGVALIGDNGQGKTNLLEAIYYLEIFRSFRGSPDEQLVRFGHEVFRVEGRMEGGPDVRRVAAAYDRKARRKKVTLDGAEPPTIGEAIGRVGAVIFSPADVAIIAGAPGERRRFLDIVLSLTEPGYLHALQRFRQVLARRNTLLRQGAPLSQVEAWNPGLAGWGSRVAAMRIAWVREHTGSFSAHVAGISGGAEAVLEYEATVSGVETSGATDPAAASDAYLAELERVAEREARRGTTLVGPHRDDLRVRAQTDDAGWVDLRTYGSGGQQRTAAVALRMVEAESVRNATGHDPVILLDDVFAELDPGRSERILHWVEAEEGGQVILTAPKPSDFEVRGGSLDRWQIRDGVLSRL